MALSLVRVVVEPAHGQVETFSRRAWNKLDKGFAQARSRPASTPTATCFHFISVDEMHAAVPQLQHDMVGTCISPGENPPTHSQPACLRLPATTPSRAPSHFATFQYSCEGPPRGLSLRNRNHNRNMRGRRGGRRDAPYVSTYIRSAKVGMIRVLSPPLGSSSRCRRALKAVQLFHACRLASLPRAELLYTT